MGSGSRSSFAKIRFSIQCLKQCRPATGGLSSSVGMIIRTRAYHNTDTVCNDQRPQRQSFFRHHFHLRLSNRREFSRTCCLRGREIRTEDWHRYHHSGITVAIIRLYRQDVIKFSTDCTSSALSDRIYRHGWIICRKAQCCEDICCKHVHTSHRTFRPFYQ